jgi:hypothetical protein
MLEIRNKRTLKTILRSTYHIENWCNLHYIAFDSYAAGQKEGQSRKFYQGTKAFVTEVRCFLPIIAKSTRLQSLLFHDSHLLLQLMIKEISYCIFQYNDECQHEFSFLSYRCKSRRLSINKLFRIITKWLFNGSVSHTGSNQIEFIHLTKTASA